MNFYKVKIGESVVDVEGLPGLIALAKEGRIGPEDPVFVPSSGRWHYARSIRQLREHFSEPAILEPPPRGNPAQEGARASRTPASDHSPMSVEQEGAQVLTLRPDRWSPDGRGVEIPIYAYEIDAEPPRILRRIVIFGGGALLVWAASTYIYGYRDYIENQAVSQIAAPAVPQSSGTPTVKRPPPPPARADVAPKAPAPPRAAGTPGAVRAAPIAVAKGAPPGAVRTPPMLPAFDAVATRGRVAEARISPVARPDDLGPAMRNDFVRLAVPVHEASLLAVKGARSASVPFTLRIDYAPTEGTDAVGLARSRFAIVAMAGRRIAELHLRLQSFHLRTLAGKRIVSDVDVPVDLASRAWNGSASGEEVSVLFAPK